jgi:PAS domain S-box-containing protein
VAELERAVAAAQPHLLVYRMACDGAPETWICDEGVLQQGDGDEPPKIHGQRRELASLLSRLEEVTKSEAEARESEQSFRFMVEHSRDVLFRGNYRTLQYDYISPNIEQIAGGFTVEDIAAMGQAKWVARLRPEDLEQLTIILGELFSRGGGTYSAEFRIPGKDGIERWVSEVGTAFVDKDGVPSYAISSCRDITDQKEKEAEREKLEAQLRRSQRIESLGTMIGGIAHDFNNLLTAIVGYADLLRIDSEDPAERRDAVDAILTASLRARDLVREILTFSRQNTPQRIPVRVGILVTETMRLLRTSVPSSIVIECRGNALEEHVYGDPTELHQLLMNLCVNGAQAMPEGGRLTFEADVVGVDDPAGIPLVAGSLTSGRYVRFVVEDTGGGMTEEVMQRMFEPFFTTKELRKGTGLGLSVAHGIVLDHRAALAVTSSPSKGSRFEAYLPIWDKPIDKPAMQPAPDAAQGERVLVVDDEPYLVELVGHILHDLGYEPVGVDTPGEALVRLSADPAGFWAVMTDLTMPHMTGLVLARYVREMAPTVPVVLATGNLGDMTPEELADTRIVTVLSKPYTVADVEQALDVVREHKKHDFPTDGQR